MRRSFLWRSVSVGAGITTDTLPNSSYLARPHSEPKRMHVRAPSCQHLARHYDTGHCRSACAWEDWECNPGNVPNSSWPVHRYLLPHRYRAQVLLKVPRIPSNQRTYYMSSECGLPIKIQAVSGKKISVEFCIPGICWKSPTGNT